MLGKRSRPLLRSTSMSQFGSVPPPPIPLSDPHIPQFAPPHASVSQNQPTVMAFADSRPQNDPNMICFVEPSFAHPEDVCMHGGLEIVNPTPSPLAPPSDSSLQVPLAVEIRSNVDSLAHEDVSQGPAVFPDESQMQEWHQYSSTSSSSDVSFANEGPYRANSIPPVDFLDACYFCKKRLGPGLDIYMYRGDRAFCSVECRHHQIVIDERREKASHTTAKRASGMTTPVRHANCSGNVVPTGTAAAA